MGGHVSIPCRRRAVLVAFAACAVANGCHRDVVPVSGRVTLNGKPLAGADVIFQPRGNSQSPRPAGTGSIGHTDEQGRFSLRMVEPNRPGAIVGEHIVRIAVNSDAPATTPAKGSPIPPVWRDGSRQFRVPPGGTTKADFDITASDPPATNAKSRRAR
jgi:hypothetical protein